MTTEKLLREWIRGILTEADGMQGTPDAPPSANPGDAPIEKTAAERAAEAALAEPDKAHFEVGFADFLEKKMKEKGVSASSINDMKKVVTGGR